MSMAVKISEQELIVFENLYEKKSALNNLIFVCDNNELLRNEILYKKFIEEYTKVEHDYRIQWDAICKKYNIHEEEGYYLNLDFASAIISLQKEI